MPRLVITLTTPPPPRRHDGLCALLCRPGRPQPLPPASVARDIFGRPQALRSVCCTARRCRWNTLANPQTAQRHLVRPTLRALAAGSRAGAFLRFRGNKGEPRRQQASIMLFGRHVPDPPAPGKHFWLQEPRPEPRGMDATCYGRQCPRTTASPRFGARDRPTLARYIRAPLHPRGSARREDRAARQEQLNVPLQQSLNDTQQGFLRTLRSDRWTPTTRVTSRWATLYRFHLEGARPPITASVRFS